MSWTAVCVGSVLRSLAIALVALPVGYQLAAQLAVTRQPRSNVCWALLVIPFLAPELIVGYGYYNFALSLVQRPTWNELLYAALLGMKLVPVATMLLYFAPPPPISREALHCRRLGLRVVHGRLRRAAGLCGYWIRGPVRSAFPAFALVFLLAFQEFEMASLMGATAWTVDLVAKHAEGLSIAESLRLAQGPLVCELVILIPVLAVTLTSRTLPAASNRQPSSRSMWRTTIVWSYLCAAAIAVFVVPFVMVFRSAAMAFVGGAHVLVGRDPFELGNILVSAGLAVTAGVVAAWVAWRLVSPSRRHTLRARTIAALVWSAPGLCGSLILGLSLIYVFQQDWSAALYDTPIPLLIGLVLFLAPRAMLLQLLLQAVQPAEAWHLAHVQLRSPSTKHRAAARELLWGLGWRGQLCAWAILCCWIYLELTLAFLLHPVRFVPVSVLLYNQMHFGQIVMLSVKVIVALAVPVTTLLIAFALRRPLLRLLIR